MIGFTKFYEENRERQINTVSKVLKFNKQMAEDIVQEAYAKAWLNLDKYDPERGTMNTWFNRILFNTLRDYQSSTPYTVSLNENMEHDDETLEYLVSVNDAIKLIKNRKHRKVLELFYISGYTSKEISEVVKGMSQSNITTVCNRFKQTLEKVVNND